MADEIVRRIDDLGRIVIPKEIRRTLRIREADLLLTTLTNGKNTAEMAENQDFSEDAFISGIVGLDGFWKDSREYIRKLDCGNGIGLIEKKRRGLGKPNIIFVKNFASEGGESGGDADGSAELKGLYFRADGGGNESLVSGCLETGGNGWLWSGTCSCAFL